jgi:hypothetical protein
MIKIHALIHGQLLAPAFRPMLMYAWYASGLCSDRQVFLNVKQIVFPDDILRTKCYCGEACFANVRGAVICFALNAILMNTIQINVKNNAKNKMKRILNLRRVR